MQYELNETPLPIRAHHALCFCAFQGNGYDKWFIENVSTIVTYLENHPTRFVKLSTQMDSACLSCPNNTDDIHCSNEGYVKSQDRNVLSVLGLKADSILTWNQVKLRIRESFDSVSQRLICKDCKWYKTGSCAKILLGGFKIAKEKEINTKFLA